MPTCTNQIPCQRGETSASKPDIARESLPVLPARSAVLVVEASPAVIEATLLAGSGQEELVARISPLPSENNIPAIIPVPLRDKLASVAGSNDPIEAMQSLLRSAESLGLKVELTFPPLNEQHEPAYVELCPLTAPKADLASEPLVKPDRLTGLPTASVLSSEAGYKMIERNVRLPNAPAAGKLAVFLDFNNMGAADRVMRLKVNSFLEQFAGFWEASCKSAGVSGVALRLGGDEFLLIMPDDNASRAALREFFKKINSKRADTFSAEHVPVEIRNDLVKAEQYAWLRTQLKAIRKEFAPEGEFSLAHYRESLLASPDISLADANRYDSAEIAMQIALARNGGIPGRQPIMTITATPPVRVPACSPGSDWRERLLAIRQAIATAKAKVSASKLLPAGSLQDTIECDPCIKIRRAERAAMTAGQAIEKKLEESASRIGANAARLAPLTALLSFERERLLANDPGINDGTLRYDRSKAHQIGRYLPLSKAIDGYGVSFDIRHFGALNNQLGYERADELVAAAARIIRKHIPGALVVRANGGSLIAITQSKPKIGTVSAIRREVNLPLRLLASDKVRAEIEERLALARWRESAETSRIEPPPVRLKIYPHIRVKGLPVRLDPELTLVEVLEKLV